MSDVPLKHLSDSAIQRLAEIEMLRIFGRQLALPSLAPTKVVVGGGATIHVDGVDEDATIFVEAYARQGKLVGAQKKKIAQDILKLSILRSQRPAARLILLFADEAAKDSITGWVKSAAVTHEIEFRTVDLGEEWRTRIIKTQNQQAEGMTIRKAHI